MRAGKDPLQMPRRSANILCPAAISGRMFLLVVLNMLVCGCVIVSGTSVLEKPFTEQQAASLRPGETTKASLVQQFGPPLIVSRPADTMIVPAPGDRFWRNSRVGIEPGHGKVFLREDRKTWNGVPVKSYFERFPAASFLAEKPLVYYYECADLKWGELVLNGNSVTRWGQTLSFQGLWVLIDERTGKVVAVRMEKAEAEAAGEEETAAPARPAGEVPERQLSWKVRVSLP